MGFDPEMTINREDAVRFLNDIDGDFEASERNPIFGARACVLAIRHDLPLPKSVGAWLLQSMIGIATIPPKTAIEDVLPGIMGFPARKGMQSATQLEKAEQTERVAREFSRAILFDDLPTGEALLRTAETCCLSTSAVSANLDRFFHVRPAGQSWPDFLKTPQIAGWIVTAWPGIVRDAIEAALKEQRA